MKENKKINNCLIIISVVLLVICMGMGTFIFINKDNYETIIKNEANKTNDDSQKCEKINYDLNTSEYGLGDSAVGLSVNIDKSRKNARITYNGATLFDAFGIMAVTAADTSIYDLIDTKAFDKKITQVLIDGAGQSVSSAAILYLMEDGTVEYVPILKELNTNWSKSDNTKKFNSYGTLEGISNIISLIPAEGNGYHTILARKADGTVIDLSSALQATGNF